MAGAPHDKTGKKCADCSTVFSKSSATYTLTKRNGNMIEHRLVCAKCHHKHHSLSE